MPLHPGLIQALAAMPVTGSETFLLMETGRPFTVKWLGKKMREWCDAAGVPPIVDECESAWGPDADRHNKPLT